MLLILMFIFFLGVLCNVFRMYTSFEQPGLRGFFLGAAQGSFLVAALLAIYIIVDQMNP